MSMTTYALMNKRINELDKEFDYSAPIFGVYWNKGDNPAFTRTHDAVGMTAAIGIDGQWVDNKFDGAPIFGQSGEAKDTLGNVFIRIPKFYIRKTDGVGFKTLAVTTRPLPGFYLPWCFWDFTKNKALPYVDSGKYKATKDGSNRLESKPNLYPLANTSIVDMRTYAQNNGAGYQQLDIHVVDAVRTLMLIEFATLDIQTVMTGYTAGRYSADDKAVDATTNGNTIVVSNTTGAYYKVGQAISVGSTLGNNSVFYGRNITQIQADTPEAGKTTITFDGATVDIAIDNVLYNSGWKNGFSANIAASSGCITANDGNYPCAYRGIESPFGDTWKYVDGVNINEYQAWVCKNAAQYASNVFASPYEQLSYVNYSAGDGFVTAIGVDPDRQFAEFPTAAGGSATTYYSDYYYRSMGQRTAQFGGAWHNGTRAGISAWTMNTSSSSVSSYIGGRLVRKAI